MIILWGSEEFDDLLEELIEKYEEDYDTIVGEDSAEKTLTFLHNINKKYKLGFRFIGE